MLTNDTTRDVKAGANAARLSIAIVSTHWHREIVATMEHHAINKLKENGIPETAISRITVPGAFEIPPVVSQLCKNQKHDAVIALGCIIRGQTPHFDFVAAPVAHALQMIQVEHGIPVIFGVLTTDTVQQAIERSNGQHGNKGIDCANAAIEMALLLASLSTL